MFQKIKEKITKKQTIGTILIFLSILIVTSIIWGNRTFAVKTLSQIVFHMKVPMSGSDTGIYLDWFIWCVPLSILATTVVDVIICNWHRVYKRNIERAIKIKSLMQRFFVHIGIFCLVVSLMFTLINYDVYGYFNNVKQNTDLYEQYYVEPSTANITFPNQKRNLIHIYLESIESTYTSKQEGGAYEKAYIPELEKLAKENTNFSNTKGIGGSMTVDGTQWTIAAMVAQSAGIPLSIPLEGNSYDSVSEFFPGTYTMGQVLQKQGYNLEILMGSDSKFAGTSNFYSQHGNYDIVDNNKVKEQGRLPEDYFVFWGFEDKKLFSLAKEDITKLAAKDEPFALTMVTIDSHTPDGYLCEDCPTTYKEQYENVLACQSKQVANFVEWAKQQDFYENTTIVITGDHNSMASKFFEGLDATYVRTPYNVIINSAITTHNTKERVFTTMDWYPTILASLGATIEGERLGLGTNLYSDTPTIIEEKGFDYLNLEVQKTSKFYNQIIIGIKD